jgi:hypothetical protein
MMASKFTKPTRSAVVFLLAITVGVSLSFARKPLGPNLKIKIEATELDRQTLLARLNANGEGHHLKFTLADEGFDYRVVFGTGQKPVGSGYGDINASTGSTAVYDAQGKELFEFKREGRWTDSGATNATAKEIIKRLLKLTQ